MSYEPRLHIVLYQPEIPQNTGNIARTCVAIEAKLWLVRPLGFRVDQKSVRRAGLDYWQHLNWEVVDDWSVFENWLDGRRPWLFTKKAEASFTTVEYQKGDVLVFGRETAGLPSTLLETYPDRLLRIPMFGPVRSLNLANSVAVAAYETLRQFELPG